MRPMVGSSGGRKPIPSGKILLIVGVVGLIVVGTLTVSLLPIVLDPFFRDAVFSLGPEAIDVQFVQLLPFLLPLVVPILLVSVVFITLRSASGGYSRRPSGITPDWQSAIDDPVQVAVTSDGSAEELLDERDDTGQSATETGGETRTGPNDATIGAVPESHIPAHCPTSYCDAAWGAAGLLDRDGGSYEVIDDTQVRCTDCGTITEPTIASE